LDFDTTGGPIKAFGVTIPGVPYAPDLVPNHRAMLGTRFIGPPPIQTFQVTVAQPNHPLVAGINNFTTEDEPYCCAVIGDIDILLESRYSSETRSELPEGSDNSKRVHPQMYL